MAEFRLRCRCGSVAADQCSPLPPGGAAHRCTSAARSILLDPAIMAPGTTRHLARHELRTLLRYRSAILRRPRSSSFCSARQKERLAAPNKAGHFLPGLIAARKLNTKSIIVYFGEHTRQSSSFFVFLIVLQVTYSIKYS
jgi:hypothetical protein